MIGSSTGMAIHFRLDINELRPLGRTARGVKSMNLRKEDNLVSMDVLTSDLVDQLAKNEDLTKEFDENLEVNSSEGPWRRGRITFCDRKRCDSENKRR